MAYNGLLCIRDGKKSIFVAYANSASEIISTRSGSASATEKAGDECEERTTA